ncbi:hypothetical protein HDR60_05680 [bacterium]|nr:hypothetical protein [bacterium]
MREFLNKFNNKYILFALLLSLLITISSLIITHFVIMLEDEITFIIPRLFYNNIYFSDRIDLSLGRFLPLQFFDYYLLKFFSPKENFQLLFPAFLIIKMTIVFILLYKILSDIGKFQKLKPNCLLMLFIFLLFLSYRAFLQITLEYKYTEITLILFILFFIFCYQRAYFTNKIIYYILALLSAIYSTYMKETIFIPYFVIGIINIFFIKKNKKLQFHKHRGKLFNLLLILNGIVLLLCYCGVYFNSYGFYNKLHRTSFIWILWDIFIILLFILGLIKIITFLLKKEKFNIYDSFLIAGISYSTAIFVLGLGGTFYHIVSFSFFLIWLYNYFITSKKYVKVLYFVCTLMLFQGIYYNTSIYFDWLRNKINATKYFNKFIIGKKVYVCSRYWFNQLNMYYNYFKGDDVKFYFPDNNHNSNVIQFEDFDIFIVDSSDPFFNEEHIKIDNHTILDRYWVTIQWNEVKVYGIRKI